MTGVQARMLALQSHDRSEFVKPRPYKITGQWKFYFRMVFCPIEQFDQRPNPIGVLLIQQICPC